MTVKMLDAVGMVVVAIIVTKGIEFYGTCRYIKGREDERKEQQK